MDAYIGQTYVGQTWSTPLAAVLQTHQPLLMLWLQGALSSSSTLMQLRAFAKLHSKEVTDDRDLDWEVLYLALRCGHFDQAIKVCTYVLVLKHRS